MKTKSILFSILVIGLMAAVLLAGAGYAQEFTDSQPEGSPAQTAPGAQVPGDDSNPVGAPEIIIPDRYRSVEAAGASPAAAATVYFTPQDENTSTTVLFLYNTSTVTATVGIETFTVSGSSYISTTVVVPPGNLVRICADTVSTISSSWTDAVLINFTTNSTYARMTLPEGVKAEGYVAWNGANPYDPLEVVPTLPLRFSTDPATVFLPASLKN